MAHVDAAAHPKATIADVKREIARMKRKNKHEHDVNYLNITAMLDMMTIILVFLLKSLASSSANIPQSADLRLPRSTARTEPSGALQITISRVSVTVNNQAVGVPLSNGRVDPSLKRGGSNSFLINPLSAAMRDHAEHARTLARRINQPFRGDLAVIADREIPMRTIYEVLYTAAQAGFSNFQLLVIKGNDGSARTH